MNKLYIGFIALVCLAIALIPIWAIHEEAVERNNSPPTLTQEQKVDTQIKYFQDVRTHLCFAGNFNSWNNVYLITNVPCTPEVLGLVKPLP